MKSVLTILSGIFIMAVLGLKSYAQNPDYQAEVKMVNFEQVSECEFKFDIQIRNSGPDPSGTNLWVYYNAQYQINFNENIMNGGDFDELHQGPPPTWIKSLRVDNTISDLPAPQQLDDDDFFWADPNDALATSAPFLDDYDELLGMDDGDWKTIATFEVQLVSADLLHWLAFSELTPDFSWFQVQTKLFYTEQYTYYPGYGYFLDQNGAFSGEISNVYGNITGFTIDVPNYELSSYYFSGTGSWTSTSNWNGTQYLEPGYANKLPGTGTSGNNALIGGYCGLLSSQSVNQLQIKDIAVLAIGTTGQLSAVEQTINDGAFLIQSGSNSASQPQAISGSFIDNGTIIGNGIFDVQRYLIENQWHYISSPISDGLSGIFEDIWLKEFIEADSCWHYIVPLDVQLTPMKGFACWSYDTGHTPPGIGTTTVNFVGTLNTGNISINLTNSGVDPNEKGYNFVGNPYPSAVDWDAAGWTKTNIDNAIYIYNPLIGQYGQYVNGIGGNDVTNIIPNGSGFFVHVTSGNTSGAIGVTNSARVHDSKPMFKDATYDFQWPYIKLKTVSEINTYSDETTICFINDATADFDSQYDAFKLRGVDEAPQMSTVSEGIEFAINSLPLSDEDVTIPVKFDVGIDGIYTIEAAETANLEDMYIYLKDLQEEVIINLNEQQNYSFFSTVDDDPARFEILFKSSPLGIGSYDITGNIRIYSDRNVVYLVSNDDLSGILKIYDMSGKTVYSDDLMGLSAYEVKLNVEKGFYIVKLFTDDKILSEKVVIFN
jgi:hypothetical protein